MDINIQQSFDEAWILIESMLDNIFNHYINTPNNVRCPYDNVGYMEIFTLIYNASLTFFHTSY